MIISTEINNVAEHNTLQVICKFVFYDTPLEKETRGGGIRSIDLNNFNTFECARLIRWLACLHCHCLNIYDIMRMFYLSLRIKPKKPRVLSGHSHVIGCEGF